MSKILNIKSIGAEIVDFDRDNLKLRLSTLLMPDAHNETYNKGAFKESLIKRKTESGYRVGFCLDHNQTKRLGSWKELYEEGDALYGVAKMTTTDLANQAEIEMKDGTLKECSTGCLWRAETGHWESLNGNPNGLFVIDKTDIIEASMVTVGANPITGIAKKSVSELETDIDSLIKKSIENQIRMFSDRLSDEDYFDCEVNAKQILQRIVEARKEMTYKRENGVYKPTNEQISKISEIDRFIDSLNI